MIPREVLYGIRSGSGRRASRYYPVACTAVSPIAMYSGITDTIMPYAYSVTGVSLNRVDFLSLRVVCNDDPDMFDLPRRWILEVDSVAFPGQIT